MSELIRLLDSRKKFAKEWKIVGWTLGMTVGVYLITDGKSMSQHPMEHALVGTAIGLILGFLFSRNQKAKSSAK